MAGTTLVTLQGLTASIFVVDCLQDVSNDSPDCILVLGRSPLTQALSLALDLALLSGTTAKVTEAEV